MSANNRTRARLDHRTNEGFFKGVVWYHGDIGYENDLEKRASAPWDDESTEAYSNFIEPLMGGVA